MSKKKGESSTEKSTSVSQSQSSEENTRREFLGRAGVIAGGMFALYTPGALVASAIDTLGQIPDIKPIADLLELKPDERKQLSPAARKATVADMKALSIGDLKSPGLADMTVGDLKSLQDLIFNRAGVDNATPLTVLRRARSRGGVHVTVSCCCCSCCCAVAI